MSLPETPEMIGPSHWTIYKRCNYRQTTINSLCLSLVACPVPACALWPAIMPLINAPPHQAWFHVKPPGGYLEGGRAGKHQKRGGPTPPFPKFLQKLFCPKAFPPLSYLPSSLTPTVPRCLSFFPRYGYTVASINTHGDWSLSPQDLVGSPIESQTS
jgi:hypothetical protein